VVAEALVAEAANVEGAVRLLCRSAAAVISLRRKP
jgi:hypothetical protein